MTHTPRRHGARVCVTPLREWGGVVRRNGESPDGAASPPRGRGRRPRHYRSTTTTNYILELVCSSSGRESNHNLRLRGGDRRV